MINYIKRLFKPMKFQSPGFQDVVSGEQVDYYICRQTGKTFMATSPRAMFRVEKTITVEDYE